MLGKRGERVSGAPERQTFLAHATATTRETKPTAIDKGARRFILDIQLIVPNWEPSTNGRFRSPAGLRPTPYLTSILKPEAPQLRLSPPV
jgi:hypothetical protein